MFEDYRGIAKHRMERGYFQLQIILNEEHAFNADVSEKIWASQAFPTMDGSLKLAKKIAKDIKSRITGATIVEGKIEDDDFILPQLYIMDAASVPVARVDVEFHDYSEETVH